MAEPADSPRDAHPDAGAEVRHLPVPVATNDVRPVEPEPGVLERPLRVQLAAPIVAATTGFLVGVATFVLVRVLRRRRGPVALRGRRGSGRSPQVAASRSFLVDVHLLRR